MKNFPKSIFDHINQFLIKSLMSFFYDLDCVIEKLKHRQYPTEKEVHHIITKANTIN